KITLSGVSNNLYKASPNEQVWKCVRKKQPDGPMEVYSSAEGYPVRAGEIYRIRSVYENTTNEQIGAMAGLFILYSPDLLLEFLLTGNLRLVYKLNTTSLHFPEFSPV